MSQTIKEQLFSIPEIQEVQSKYLTVFPESNDLIVKIILATSINWFGEVEMTQKMCEYITTMVPEYAKVFQKSNDEMLALFEQHRSYSAPEYYQKSNQPSLENVIIYKSREDFFEKHPSQKFECPQCGGESTDPQECTCEGCDWKAYGLFGTMGKGIKVLILDSEDIPTPVSIFKPIELCKK